MSTGESITARSDTNGNVGWEAPGPGHWELDRSHCAGGATPLVADVMSTSMAAGMRRVMRELGTPVDTFEMRFVNGFSYGRLRPLIRPDSPATKLPPKVLLKLAVRLHPEMRRRAASSARSLAERPWRKVVADWENGGRQTIEDENRRLANLDLSSLSDNELMVHVCSTVERGRAMLEHHFWLHGYDLGPIGLLVESCGNWGIAPGDALALLEGSSPSTSEPSRLLVAIREAIEASGKEVATLGEARAVSPHVAALIDAYLEHRHALLFSRYDLDGRTLGEVPGLVLTTIMTSRVHDRSAEIEARIVAARSKVPTAGRAEFDERLAEARSAMNLRDDNGPVTAEVPLGIIRLALLEVGRRLVATGRASVAERAVEVTAAELAVGLLSGVGPSSDELDRRWQVRNEQRRLSPPLTLGRREPMPPPDVLPGALGRMTRVVQTVVEQLGMGGDRAESNGLSGSGIGSTVYRGIARVADSPEAALDALEPGDVLVVPLTTPAYNVVLSIAGAVVTASGGPMCHAAVLARELGIPAVVGAAGALTMIPDGALVEVDPIAGEVRVVDSAGVT